MKVHTKMQHRPMLKEYHRAEVSMATQTRMELENKSCNIVSWVKMARQYQESVETIYYNTG